MAWGGLGHEIVPLTQAAARVATTAATVSLIKRLPDTKIRGFPPKSGSVIFDMAVVPSLLYGLVQMDIGPFRAGTRGRLVPSNLGAIWAALARVAHAALCAISPVWRTI
jgi:hypothetical protein